MRHNHKKIFLNTIRIEYAFTKFILKFFSFFLFFLASFATTSAANDSFTNAHSTVSLIAGKYSNNGDLELGLEFNLKPGWKIYWRSPGNAGFPPMLDWSESKNASDFIFSWPAPNRSIDKYGDLVSVSNTYSKHVIFPISAKTPDPSNNADLVLNLNYAICSDICIPASALLSTSIKPNHNDNKGLERIDKFMRKVPTLSHPSITLQESSLASLDNQLNFTITAKHKNRFITPDIFIESNNNAISFTIPDITLKQQNSTAIIEFSGTNLTDKSIDSDTIFTLTMKDDNIAASYDIAYADLAKVSMPTSSKSESFAIILIFALIGGFILNAMPCVLPVLGIKLIGIAKHGGGDKTHVRTSFLAAAAGIIASFIALALIIISLQAAGKTVGWGFQFQEPTFIITLVIILTLFSANLWGLYEINLPQSITRLFEDRKHREGMAGHFLSGVFATILATPCTAPFLGTAVGFALTRDKVDIILTFLAMGLGMAIPYLTLSLFPKCITMLPKPGKWMIGVKHFLGTLLAATAIWLIWVISHQLGVTAAIVLLTLSIIKISKFWASKHIDFLRVRSVRYSLLTLLIVLAFAIPLRISEEQSTVIDIEMLWQPFDVNKILPAIQEGKVVFVDVTADWCLTCKVNSFLVLQDKDITTLLSSPDILAMRADWTNKNDQITTYLKSHDRFGIPFNAVYGPKAKEGIVLPELLSETIVIEAIGNAK